MGNRTVKSSLDPNLLDKLVEETGLEREVIIAWRKQFLSACPSNKMNRKDFYKFYRSLRVESDDKVKEIVNFIFTAFDRDSNGKIDFTEFLCGYAITSLGTMRQKLDYVFAVYDKDKNNSIDRKEMVRVISAMYDLLGKSREDYPPERCVNDVFSLIDVNNDQSLTKDEFIDGVLKNPYLSDLISPFNE
ncbi:unnamed protein product [Adineta steineri]|uniref:EF-hand domain-containing protein n=1 Tax=Adineta steineri TaxID=433720 RepID=A0A818MIG2_9BILA|nr:unnamed protein product [Adineta steineri]CAF1021737.1 unnamed protein product [Adineta steineri]CAF1069626.1 unnamed protein product [Adineta steineri]CAF3589820.1 unnamed protein product [Adineta steineri]CAF3601029.1 unnamed protein product [Adineta steineri]